LPTCPNNQPPFVHDFGSILNFTEYAFGQNGSPIGRPKGIYPTYPCADYYAPDGPNNTNICSPATCRYSLSDFFPNNFRDPPRTFTPFTQGVKYPGQCFVEPNVKACFGSDFTPMDPDEDAVDGARGLFTPARRVPDSARNRHPPMYLADSVV
jgi:hypothetical protein